MSEHRVALERALLEVRQALAALDALGDEHRAHRSAVDQQHAAAWRALAESLVPEIGPALDQLAERLHDSRFSEEAVRNTLASRRAALVKQRDELTATAGFNVREVALDEVVTRKKELDEHLSALEQSLAQLEQDPVFQALYDTGYGTPDDNVGFWRLSYYRRGTQAQELAKRFSETSWDALRARYLREREAASTLRRDRADLDGQAARLGAVARLYTETLSALEHLESAIVEELRARCLDALRALDPRRLAELIGKDHRARVLALDGTLAKGRYLSAVYQHHVEDRRGHLFALAHDLELAISGDMSRRYVLGGSPHEIDSRLRAQSSEVERDIRAHRAIAERVLGFSGYRRFQVGDLWWDHMCGRAFDGAFIDEVIWHRTQLAQRGVVPSGSVLRAPVERADWEDVQDERSARAAAALEAALKAAPDDVDFG